MNAVEVLRAALDAGVRIEKADDTLYLESDRAPSAALVDAIRGCKSDILVLLEKSGARASGLVPSNVQSGAGGSAAPALDRHHGLSEDDLEAVAGDDWSEIVGDPVQLAAFADAVAARRRRERGERPPGWNTHVSCAGCGPVYLWPGSAPTVRGCPWCSNRAKGRRIPRPEAVTCGTCRHFRRTDHPHLGHRDAGEPEAMAGQWDTDRRGCGQWLPLARSHGGGPDGE